MLAPFRSIQRDTDALRYVCPSHPTPADLPTATGQLLRSVALFTLVNALAEALRSVFVPYYGLLVDACVAHLSGGWRPGPEVVVGGVGGARCRCMGAPPLAWPSRRVRAPADLSPLLPLPALWGGLAAPEPASEGGPQLAARAAPSYICLPCPLFPADGSVAAAGKKGKKKRRKGEEAGAEDGAMPARDALYVEHDWRLRLKVC